MTFSIVARDPAMGDSRGRQSAALLIRREKGGTGGADDRWIDLRTDDHTDPVTELGRLLALHEKQSNLADPENLPKVASAITSGLVGAVRRAVRPSEHGTGGTLTAWAPPQAEPGPGAPMDGDAG